MQPRIRIPSAADFKPLEPEVTVRLAFPSPPESTVAILVLFHGLGDSEGPFAGFAQSLALPGVLAIAVRGVNPLPPALLGEDLGDGPTTHFHWGDDLALANDGSGGLDPDPGFEKATRLVLDRLVRDTLVGKCGWNLTDIFLFGFGQGGSLALGLASAVRMAPQVEELAKGEREEDAQAAGRRRAFKGVVSIGGPLLPSTITSVSAREKARTPVLVCYGSASEVVDEEAIEVLRQEFVDVRVAKWKRPGDGMPANKDEVLPMMQFFAERLRTPW